MKDEHPKMIRHSGKITLPLFVTLQSWKITLKRKSEKLPSVVSSQMTTCGVYSNCCLLQMSALEGKHPFSHATSTAMSLWQSWTASTRYHKSSQPMISKWVVKVNNLSWTLYIELEVTTGAVHVQGRLSDALIAPKRTICKQFATALKYFMP